MDDLDAANALTAEVRQLEERELERRVAGTIDDLMGFGKHRSVTYREVASRDPSYLQWAAKTLGGERGRLSAEALAIHLGVVE